jgi:serine phosphatase RsbU (regulator of sigma subunit)
LVNRLQRSVDGYMDGADQFDDLTLLVLRVS